jgi:hypothetical protein
VRAGCTFPLFVSSTSFVFLISAAYSPSSCTDGNSGSGDGGDGTCNTVTPVVVSVPAPSPPPPSSSLLDTLRRTVIQSGGANGCIDG